MVEEIRVVQKEKLYGLFKVKKGYLDAWEKLIGFNLL